MFLLDIKTVIFFSILINCACIGIFTFFWIQNRSSYSGIHLWLLNSICQLVGLTLIVLRGIIPDFASIVVSNTLIVTGVFILLIGFERFLRVKSYYLINFIIIALFIIIHSYFTYILPDLNIRNINCYTGILIFCAQLIYLLFYRTPLEYRPLTRLSGIVFSGFCLISLIHIVSAFFNPNNQDFFNSPALDVLLIIFFQLASILLLFSMMYMINGFNILTIQKSQTKIIHSSKLASIGILAAGVAHEINNPLTIALGNIEILKSKCKDLCKVNSPAYIDKTQKACLRIVTIVKGLKNFAIPDSDEWEPVDIHQSISKTLELVSAMFNQENITIETTFKCTFPIVWANMGKLQQVIMNLLTNARDAIKEIHDEGIIRIVTGNNDKTITIEISDNGIGIDNKNQNNLFDAFYTTKAPGKGMGLGLSISHSIITSFGGTINFESKKNIGTTFIITLQKEPS